MGDKRSSFARSAYAVELGEGEEVELDENVPVPRSRPLGRMASRRNLSGVAKRASVRTLPLERKVEARMSGDSVSSAAASLTSASGRGNLTSPVAVSADPPRNAEENYLRQSMLRTASVAGNSGAAAAFGFDMNAIHAALREDEALEAGFDDREVLEQYRIMAQLEAKERVKANTGFDMEDYEKRRKATGSETKDKKEMFGGGKKPHLPLPPPHHVISSSTSNGSMSSPPTLTLSHQRGSISENYRRFMEEQELKEEISPELTEGEKTGLTHSGEGNHHVRCWGCKENLGVNYVATLVQCPCCGTVSQARKKN